jgi:type I restriction enzyme M protein
MAKNKGNHGFRARNGELLFIDARKLGHMVDRTRREFSDSDIFQIANTYHAWRGETHAGEYRDISGFCKSVTAEQIKTHNYILTPGRYVGTDDVANDGIPFVAKFSALVATLDAQLEEARRLGDAIGSNLKKVIVSE